MALFSNKKQLDRARREAARQSFLAGLALEETEAAKARQRSSEEARLAVFQQLGAEPAPAVPGAPPATGSGEPGDIYDTTSDAAQRSAAARGLVRYGHKLGPGVMERLEGTRKGILDPTKYAQEVGKGAGFQIQSKLTREAKQLLEREGPAWERLEQATHGQIFEGTATMLRESMREIRNAAAKGGTARRAALNDANRILAIESANRAKIQETWNANLKLDAYVRANAAAVQEQNRAFLDGLPGIRDTYNNTMNNLSKMMTEITIPRASDMISKARQARQSVPESNVIEKLIMGTITGIASAVAPGIGSAIGGLASSAVSGIGSALMPQSTARTTGVGGGATTSTTFRSIPFFEPFEVGGATTTRTGE